MKSEMQFIVSMIIFGTIGLVVKYIDLSSSETALLSSSIGCIFLTIIFLIMKKAIPWKLVKANVLLLVFSGMALGGNWIFLYQSYDHTTVTNATLGYYFAPVFVMILSPIVLKENLPIKKIFCIGTAILGMLLIVGNGISDSGKDDLLGIFFGLVAAAFYASLMLLNKFIKHMDKLEVTFIQLGITAVLLLPYVLFTEGSGILNVAESSIPFIILLGIVNTGIGFWLFFSGMQKLKGQTIAMLSYVDPFVAILISAVILREQMTAVQMLGGALLLSSTFISENDIFEFSKPLNKILVK